MYTYIYIYMRWYRHIYMMGMGPRVWKDLGSDGG
jgi:hypothetical protein